MLIWAFFEIVVPISIIETNQVNRAPMTVLNRAIASMRPINALKDKRAGFFFRVLPAEPETDPPSGPLALAVDGFPGR